MKVERVAHPARDANDLRKRLRVMEATAASSLLHPVIDTHEGRIHALEVFVQTLTAPPPVVPPPPAISGPRQIGGSNIGASYKTPGTYKIGAAGFAVPTGGLAVTVIASLVCVTHWWNSNTEADAWLEIVGSVASTRTNTPGGYLSTVTISKTIGPVALAAGTYTTDFVLVLGSGNQVQVTGGAIAVWGQ